MKLYTRKGDTGTTQLIGGRQVGKDSLRVSTYGEIDELNSEAGKLASLVGIKNADIKEEIYQAQQYLFDCGTDTANSDPEKLNYRLKSDAVDWLEERTDYWAGVPEETETFILPGGVFAASQAHACRTKTRSVERTFVSFQWTNDTNENILKFLNRLSDYFYSIARVLNFRDGQDDVPYERSGKVFH